MRWLLISILIAIFTVTKISGQDDGLLSEIAGGFFISSLDQSDPVKLYRYDAVTMDLMPVIVGNWDAIYNVTPSPDGRWLGFTAIDESSKIDVYAIKVDGSDLRRLTQNNNTEEILGWAGNNHMVITSYGAPNGGPNLISLLDVESGSLQLISSTRQYGGLYFEYSPHTSSLLFTEIAYGGWGDLYAMNLDGTGRHNLTSTFKQHEYQASWSPDGGQILYGAATGSAAGPYEQVEIRLMNADGTNQREIVTVAGYTMICGWSPNQKFIAFVDIHGLQLIETEGNEIHQLNLPFPSERISCPIWTNDGQHIVIIVADFFNLTVKPTYYIVDIGNRNIEFSVVPLFG